MSTAKLIDLMVNLIIYPCVVILYTVVSQCIVHMVLTKAINNLKRTLGYNKLENIQLLITIITFIIFFSDWKWSDYIILNFQTNKKNVCTNLQCWKWINLSMLYLYLLKIDHNASFRTTWNIPNLNFHPNKNSTIMMTIKIILQLRKLGFTWSVWRVTWIGSKWVINGIFKWKPKIFK